MTEYTHLVERQKMLLEAEEWAKKPQSLQAHRLTSMWYETKESKKDLEKGSVLDITYNNGLIVREQNGKVIREFTEYKMSEEELLRAYGSSNN